MIKVINFDYSFPLSCHILITSKCNLNCPGCFYKSTSEISFEKISDIFQELKKAGTRSIALGGGEPLLHPEIARICALAKKLSFYLAITSNGTILRNDIECDRIHFSFDSIHLTDSETILKVIQFYRNKIKKIGTNHILTDKESLEEALSMPVEYLTLLLEKPSNRFNDWELLLRLYGHSSNKAGKKIWFDACLMKFWKGKECNQGKTSMSINSELKRSRCSNVNYKIPYTNLQETWKEIRKDKTCLFETKEKDDEKEKKTTTLSL
jgi:organic radical activating enzyme